MEMPREKIIKKGVDALEDYELLAIMLGSGSRAEDVITLSKRLINDYGLNALLKMSYEDLKSIKGIKEAKATKLMAAFELARRGERKIEKYQIEDAKSCYEYMKSFYLYKEVEEFLIVFVDTKCRVIDYVQYKNDEAFKVALPMRSILKKALSVNCFGAFVAHNHPSNDLHPSKDDIITTKLLQRALRDINVILFDHLIIGKDDFFSFGDNKLL